MGNPFAQLKLLHQSTTVDEYVEAFEVLMAQVPPLSKDQYMGFFLGGLREDIRIEVFMFEPPNHHCLISAARLIERKLDRSPSQRVVPMLVPPPCRVPHSSKIM